MKSSMRKILVIFLILSVALGIQGSAFAGSFRNASAPGSQSPEEVLYYVDTGTTIDNVSFLFRVHLDAASGEAHLNLLPNGTLPYNHVDVLAATPDGSRIYFIDDGPFPPNPPSATLGYYDVSTASVHEVGILTVGGVNFVGSDQAAFSPDGVLYATNTQTDRLYMINPDNAQVMEIGQVVDQPTSQVINIRGADIAFGVDGTLYLWANHIDPIVPRGLYVLTLPVGSGNVFANLVGTEPTANAPRVSGLVVRANGYGDVAASTFDSKVLVVSKSDGQAVATFPMVRDGASFTAQSGDMSTGPLALCNRSMGFWKNHSWGGRVVTILGVPVDETTGMNVLWNARGWNFSMLFAQLIAAKLDTNNSTGIAAIDEAEAWLAGQDVINPDGTINWFKEYTSTAQKQEGNRLKDAVEGFIMDHHCNDQEPDPDANPDPCWVETLEMYWCDPAAQNSGQVLFIPVATR